MRRNKLTILTLMVVGLLMYISCRKVDTPQNEQGRPNLIEEKFFSSHRTADPIEMALVEFLKRNNEKEKFVEKTVKQIGYPRWDKAITKAKARVNGRGSSDSSYNTYYIPFVRDSQNFVNASMIIRTSLSDTSFTYKCDWQYSQIQNNITSISDSAEYFALFFMTLDNNVFGYRKFNIVDTNLFKHGNHRPLQVSFDSANINGRNNLFALVEFCQDVTISFNDCTYPGYAECTPTCDGCYECTSSLSYEYCWEEYVYTGGGGGGTGGTGGGSGGSGGGSTPPECGGPTPAARSNVAAPCGGGGGWTPIPTDGPYVPKHSEGMEQQPSIVSEWDIQTFSPQTLPSFSDFDSNYPKDSTGCELDTPSVYAMAGGPLYAAHLNDTINFGNACALRTSIALTKCGITIPLIRERQADGSYRNVTKLGANGKYYFITANDLYWWMIKTFGTPPATHIVTRGEAPDGEFSVKLPAENGIYIMRALDNSLNGFGATGHVSLHTTIGAVQCGHLYGSNTEVGGGIRDVSLWKLN